MTNNHPDRRRYYLYDLSTPPEQVLNCLVGDLRTPLSLMQVVAHLLADSNLDDDESRQESKRDIEKLADLSTDALEILDDTLNYLRRIAEMKRSQDE